MSQKNKMITYQRKMDDQATVCTSKKAAELFIETVIKKGEHIVQADIDLLRYEKRYVDFRLMMQKSLHEGWQCSGIVASMGIRGGVCSNYHSSKKDFHFDSFFNKYTSLSREQVSGKKQEIIKLARDCCEIMDSKGNYADIGVDIGFDVNFKPWVFELNNRRHSHKVALLLNDYDLYHRIKCMPVKYAVEVSKFRFYK